MYVNLGMLWFKAESSTTIHILFCQQSAEMILHRGCKCEVTSQKRDVLLAFSIKAKRHKSSHAAHVNCAYQTTEVQVYNELKFEYFSQMSFKHDYFFINDLGHMCILIFSLLLTKKWGYIWKSREWTCSSSSP